MRKRIGIFYLSTQAGPGRVPLRLADGAVVWIRIEEIFSTRDVGEVLDMATPAADESVMNSHELN